MIILRSVLILWQQDTLKLYFGQTQKIEYNSSACDFAHVLISMQSLERSYNYAVQYKDSKQQSTKGS